jgi:guanylate kinase
MSISATTRQPRKGEMEGQDYFFVSPSMFTEMAATGAFLEHALVFGNHYGTPREPVMLALAHGRDVLFDIDWQGTQQLRQHAGDDLVSIFVLPPSHEELERRLRARAQDSEEVVAARMARANHEISHWAEYDYVVINDDLDITLQKIQTILRAERMKRSRQAGIPAFVGKLMA